MIKSAILLEKEVLGVFMVDEKSRKHIDGLEECDFIEENSKKVFNCIKELYTSSKEIDTFSIMAKSKVATEFIYEITGMFETATNIRHKVKSVKDMSNRRALMRKADEIRAMCSDANMDVEDIKSKALDGIENDVKSIIENDGVINLKEAMVEAVGEIEKRAQNKDDKSLYTNISKLDRATAGLHNEELTVIAARPGQGKTVLGMQIAREVAKNGKRVMFTSLEMSSQQLCERIIASQARISSDELRRGDIKDEGWIEIMQAANRSAAENFMIDKTSRKPCHIKAKIKKYKPELVVIDYIQLLEPDTNTGSRHVDVGSISRALKLMTLEFKIPIVILSQLNRDADGKLPKMSDIRESGSIEQDSDNIIFIHTPEDDKEIDALVNSGAVDRSFIAEMCNRGNRVTQLILEKQRNGPTGAIMTVFNPKIMKFLEIGE